MQKLMAVFALSLALLTSSFSVAGSPAARVGDPTAFGGTIVGPGAPTVLIGGLPAARLGDLTVNPLVFPGPLPCKGGPIAIGSTTVIIAGLPAARLGDTISTPCGPDTIIFGAPTVDIGG